MWIIRNLQLGGDRDPVCWVFKNINKCFRAWTQLAYLHRHQQSILVALRQGSWCKFGTDLINITLLYRLPQRIFKGWFHKTKTNVSKTRHMVYLMQKSIFDLSKSSLYLLWFYAVIVCVHEHIVYTYFYTLVKPWAVNVATVSQWSFEWGIVYIEDKAADLSTWFEKIMVWLLKITLYFLFSCSSSSIS